MQLIWSGCQLDIKKDFDVEIDSTCTLLMKLYNCDISGGGLLKSLLCQSFQHSVSVSTTIYQVSYLSHHRSHRQALQDLFCSQFILTSYPFIFLLWTLKNFQAISSCDYMLSLQLCTTDRLCFKK